MIFFKKKQIVIRAIDDLAQFHWHSHELWSYLLMLLGSHWPLFLVTCQAHTHFRAFALAVSLSGMIFSQIFCLANSLTPPGFVCLFVSVAMEKLCPQAASNPALFVILFRLVNSLCLSWMNKGISNIGFLSCLSLWIWSFDGNHHNSLHLL